MKNETFEINDLANRWINILRAKAHQYEHRERKDGKTVISPDIDDICNEMIAYFTAINNKN